MDPVEDQTPQNDSPQPVAEQSRADVVLNLESMIKSHIRSLDRLKTEVEKHQGLLDGIFDNDPTYQKHCELAKEASKVKSATKQQILKQPQAAEAFEKVRSLKSEVKEIQSALSDYLREYQRLSGLTEIEGDDGEVREIVYTAKLVKRSSRP